MREDNRIALNQLVAHLGAYTGRPEEKRQYDFDTIWYAFKKYCSRNSGIINRKTLKVIEDRGWMSPTQAQKFCDYAGLEYLK